MPSETPWYVTARYARKERSLALTGPGGSAAITARPAPAGSSRSSLALLLLVFILGFTLGRQSAAEQHAASLVQSSSSSSSKGSRQLQQQGAASSTNAGGSSCQPRPRDCNQVRRIAVLGERNSGEGKRRGAHGSRCLAAAASAQPTTSDHTGSFPTLLGTNMLEQLLIKNLDLSDGLRVTANLTAHK